LVLKQTFRIIAILFSLLVLQNCAKKGRPTGGPKDEMAPIMVTAVPPYETVNFKDDKIKIYFDEFITLKELNKQLIVSPPPKNPPLISPQGTPSKFIEIEILDTLVANTTYIYNFGNSVQDNNEGNILESFSYVFSTGNYIDSLTLKGKVKDAYKSKNIEDVRLLLYKVDSTYTDSIVYKRKPDYVTSALDTTDFTFENLKDGEYKIFAIEDKVNDYIFDPITDKIGYQEETLMLPKDSLLIAPLRVFKEVPGFKFSRAKESRKGLVIFGFRGDSKDLKIDLLSEVPEDFKSIQFKDQETDTINYYHSLVDVDSLNFIVSNKEFIDTVTVKLRKKKLDSLTISKPKGILEFTDTLFIQTNNPVVKIDTSLIEMVDKDTVTLNHNLFVSKRANKLGLLFEKKYKQKYRLTLYPYAVTDVYGTNNKDTINFSFNTRDIEDYGTLTVQVDNPELKPVLVQLVDNKDEILRSKKLESNGKTEFKHLVPKEYKIRFVIDENENGIWDTGNYLRNNQPEEIIYYKSIEVRAYFDHFENFTITE